MVPVQNPELAALHTNTTIEQNALADVLPQAVGQGENHPRHFVRKTLAGLALGCAVLFGGAQPAEAATPDTTISAQAESQGSGFNFDLNTYIPLGIATTGLVLSVYQSIRQGKHKRGDDFNKAVDKLEADSSGERRIMGLNGIKLFVKHKEFTTEIFDTTVAYLQGRREALDGLREAYETNPKGPLAKYLESGMDGRRNADRRAINLFCDTLRRVRTQLDAPEGGVVAQVIKRALRGRATPKPSKAQLLAERTGGQLDEEKLMIDARGVNMDYMRDHLKMRDFDQVDLTGSGMQGNKIILRACSKSPHSSLESPCKEQNKHGPQIVSERRQSRAVRAHPAHS